MAEPEKLTLEELVALIEAGKEDVVFQLLADGVISWEKAGAAIQEAYGYSQRRAETYLEDRGYPKPPEGPTLPVQRQNILAELEAGKISHLEATTRLYPFYEAQGYTGSALWEKINADVKGVVARQKKAAAEQVEAALPSKISEVQDFYKQNQASPSAYRQATNDLKRILEEAGPDSAWVKDLIKETKLPSEDYDNLARALLPLPRPEEGLGLLPDQPSPPFVRGYPRPDQARGGQPPVPSGPPPLPPSTPFVQLPPEQQAQFQSAWLQPPPELPEGYWWQPTSPDYAVLYGPGGTFISGGGPGQPGGGPTTLEGYPNVWRLTPELQTANVQPFTALVPTPEDLAEKRQTYEIATAEAPAQGKLAFEEWMAQPFNQPEQDVYGRPNPYLPAPTPTPRPGAAPGTSGLRPAPIGAGGVSPGYTTAEQYDPYTAFLQGLGVGGREALSPVEQYQVGQYAPAERLFDVGQKVGGATGAAIPDTIEDYALALARQAGGARGTARSYLQSIMGLTPAQRTAAEVGYGPKYGTSPTTGERVLTGQEGDIGELQNLLKMAYAGHGGGEYGRFLARKAGQEQQIYASRQAAGEQLDPFMQYLQKKYNLKF